MSESASVQPTALSMTIITMSAEAAAACERSTCGARGQAPAGESVNRDGFVPHIPYFPEFDSD
jgi:hypothetical protein